MSLCRPIIVSGAERSGTSVCAEMVHAWGAHAGDPGELPAADQMNPRGRWEYLPLWDLLAEIGESATGSTWWAGDFQQKVAAKAADPKLAGRAQALVARMAAPDRPWLWKDPALCHFLGFWRPFWHDPVLSSWFAIPWISRSHGTSSAQLAAFLRCRWHATCCAGST